MFIHYVKILLRNLYKKKIYSFVNMTGLAIGIASFILIMLFVVDELGYDRHHSRADRIYRLCMVYDFGGVGENSASQPFPVAFTLKDEYPDMVQNIVRIFNFQSTRNFIEYGDLKFIEKRFFFADSTFFEIFDHEFIAGNAKTALDEPNSVVITESIAGKYFRDEDPLGKIIDFESGLHLKVTGIIKDVPEQSHFIFDFIGSMGSVKNMFRGRLPDTWVWNPCWTYLLLSEGASVEQLELQLPEFTEKFFFDAQKESITLYTQPLTDIHLRSKLDYEIQPNSNITYIGILIIIAVFILIIASINFMNLATATSGTRAREIGIRKVTGAYRSQLIGQFLGESLFLTLISMILAFILVEIVMPVFNGFTGKDLEINSLFTLPNFFLVLILWLVVGIFSGLYPAFFLSAFKPISVLRGMIGSEVRRGTGRKILVVFQFTVTIALLVGTLVIFSQLKYVGNTDLGFNKDNIVLLPVNRTAMADLEVYTSFKNELLQNPDILSVTAMDDIIGAAHNTHEFRPEGVPEDEWHFFPALVIRHDFVKTFEIEIVSGRDYSEDFKTDAANSVLINEAMVKHLGWRSNLDALGRKFRSLAGDERVIGVFKDFHATSLHEASGPFVLNIKERPIEIRYFIRYVAIKIGHGDPGKTLAFIRQKWNDFEDVRPFDYSFLDDELSGLYEDEKNLGMLSLVFTLIIMFIAALGLFGLASFMAEKRTKEISIRKVMGASIIHIFMLLSGEFVKLILIATFIAWPLSYFLIDEFFLNQFYQRVPLNVWIFIMSGLFALIIALIITSYRAITASHTNPAESLKYE